jgi:hypothetical protein
MGGCSLVQALMGHCVIISSLFKPFPIFSGYRTLRVIFYIPLADGSPSAVKRLEISAILLLINNKEK